MSKSSRNNRGTKGYGAPGAEHIDPMSYLRRRDNANGQVARPDAPLHQKNRPAIPDYKSENIFLIGNPNAVGEFSETVKANQTMARACGFFSIGAAERGNDTPIGRNWIEAVGHYPTILGYVAATVDQSDEGVAVYRSSVRVTDILSHPRVVSEDIRSEFVLRNRPTLIPEVANIYWARLRAQPAIYNFLVELIKEIPKLEPWVLFKIPSKPGSNTTFNTLPVVSRENVWVKPAVQMVFDAIKAKCSLTTELPEEIIGVSPDLLFKGLPPAPVEQKAAKNGGGKAVDRLGRSDYGFLSSEHHSLAVMKDAAPTTLPHHGTAIADGVFENPMKVGCQVDLLADTMNISTSGGGVLDVIRPTPWAKGMFGDWGSKPVPTANLIQITKLITADDHEVPLDMRLMAVSSFITGVPHPKYQVSWHGPLCDDAEVLENLRDIDKLNIMKVMFNKDNYAVNGLQVVVSQNRGFVGRYWVGLPEVMYTSVVMDQVVPRSSVPQFTHPELKDDERYFILRVKLVLAVSYAKGQSFVTFSKECSVQLIGSSSGSFKQADAKRVMISEGALPRPLAIVGVVAPVLRGPVMSKEAEEAMMSGGSVNGDEAEEE